MPQNSSHDFGGQGAPVSGGPVSGGPVPTRSRRIAVPVPTQQPPLPRQPGGPPRRPPIPPRAVNPPRPMPTQRPRLQRAPAQLPPERPRHTADDPGETTRLPAQPEAGQQPQAWSRRYEPPKRASEDAAPARPATKADERPSPPRRTRVRPPEPNPRRVDSAVVVAAIVMVLLAAGVFIGLLTL